MLLAADDERGIAKSLGLGILGFAEAFSRQKPNLVLVLGDRFEMHAAALTATVLNLPVAHIHGGELTYGAVDEVFRHSITKLSHFHFVATEDYARRVRQMGEEDWRVVVSGAPSLDNLTEFRPMDRSELAETVGLPFDPPPILVTFHAETREYDRTVSHAAELLSALREFQLPIVITQPNADAGGRAIEQMMQTFAQQIPHVRYLPNLGTVGYFSLMFHAAAMVGNSSSGIVEAPSFGLPVVNVGARQAGRLRAPNVIDVPCTKDAIAVAIRRAITPGFRQSIQGITNPYGNGHAASIIVERLSSMVLDKHFLLKQFVDRL